MRDYSQIMNYKLDLLKRLCAKFNNIFLKGPFDDQYEGVLGLWP